jgi:uncharacterized repeat protein (TIGR01451 family)
MLALATSGPVRAQAGCTAGACVTAGPRLVSVDSSQGPLLNLLFQALLPGTSVNLSVLDWNAIATADINLNALITQLGTNLSLSDPSQVLNANITLAQLRLAMTQVLAADGNTAAVNALNLLPLNVAGLAGTFQLGDLLQIALPQGSLADIDLDVLDLLTGSVQLYNFENVLTTPQPVTVNTAALGLTGVANVQLWLQVVEPPVYVCGPQGTSFHTSAIRIKLNTDLVQGLDLSGLTSALNALSVGGLVNIDNAAVTASVLKLQVYADVARAEGTIGAIDAVNSVVTLDARPGLVGLYVGTIADSVFFNRTQVITNAVVTPMVLTDLDVRFRVSTLAGLGIADVQLPVAVQVRAAATGAPELLSVTVNGPFPQTRTLTSGTVSLGTLVSQLLTNLDITYVAGNPQVTLLGALPLPLPIATIVNAVLGTVEGTLDALIPPIVSPVLNTLFGLVDNLLGLLGIRIGQAVFTVEGVAVSCTADVTIAKSDNSLTYTPGGTATYVITVSNAGPAAVTDAAVADTLPDGVTLSGAWTCSVTQGTGACDPGSGGAAGGQAINLTVDLSAGGVVTINVPVTFSANPAAY